MRKTILKSVIYIAACLIVPFVITMCMTGNNGSGSGKDAVKTVVKQNDLYIRDMDMTDYVIGTVAAYYKAEDSPEFLKAFAVVIRTYGEYVKSNGAAADSAGPALKFMSTGDMQTAWGSDYGTYYNTIKKAVDDTKNEVMQYDNKLFIPYFHIISTGYTRASDIGYLSSVDCIEDRNDDNYISVVKYTDSEALDRLENTWPDIRMDAEDAGVFQIIERDDSGYVTEIMAGRITTDGETFASCMGLKSSSFTVNISSGNVIFTVKGDGAGYGMSLCNARTKASAGAVYKEILNYYYKNITITNV